jgi:trehalose 6-phosphate synthase
VPVQYRYTSIEPDELTAMYTTAEVCFISSTRNGMNLVCSEYVACHSGDAIHSSPADAASGSLVLSKFVGAADCLDGALIVNPWDKEACADALVNVLSMDANEACARMEKLGSKVE